MHQISIQQLAVKVPKRVSEWSCQDVCTWLTLNDVGIDQPKMMQLQVDGAKLKTMTPNDWITNFGCTKFISKQIVDWLEEEADQFDDLVREASSSSSSSSSSQNAKVASDKQISNPRESISEDLDPNEAVSQGNVSEDESKLSLSIPIQEVTERVEKRKLSHPIEEQKTKVKSIEVSENESLNVAKWVKKKKEDTKAFNERLKQKSKEIGNKNPKLYDYININYTQPNQNIGSQKDLQRKISSAHPQPTEPIRNPNVKFVSSEFIPLSGSSSRIFTTKKILKVKAQSLEVGVEGHTMIGRAKTNQLCLSDESVSRIHAEIVPCIQMDGSHKFCLTDLGSKFGTFVECKGVQQEIEGKSYLVGDAQIEIVSIDVNKQGQIGNRRPTFDLIVKIDREKEMCLLNRASVSIGKRSNNDIRIENNCVNARIWMEKERKFCLEGVEGKLYAKLKEKEPLDIESCLDENGRVEVVFGWLRASIQVFEICLNCDKTISECNCSPSEDMRRKPKY